MLLFGAGRLALGCGGGAVAHGLGQDGFDRFENGAGFGGLGGARRLQRVELGAQGGIDQVGIAKAAFIGLAQGGGGLF